MAAKLSAEERIKQQLAVAREQLAKAKAEIEPKIKAARERVNELDREHKKVEKEERAANDALNKARDVVTERLFGEYTRATLEKQIAALLGEHGLTRPSVHRLAIEYAKGRLDAEPEIQEAQKNYEAASRREKQLYRQHNVACSDRVFDLGMRTLRNCEQSIDQLERELATLEDRRKNQRNRRAEEREAEKYDDETAKAKELMQKFVFQPEVK